MPFPTTEVRAQRELPDRGQTPLVSVVIPTFNSGTFIRGAVETVLRQTYPQVEIIVIDDGSTDDTPEKLADYISSGHIQYIFQENRGLSAARNTGLGTAKGKYVQFLDADDLLAPSKIEKQVKLLEQSGDTHICASDFRFFTDADGLPSAGGDQFRGRFPIDRAEQIFAFQTVIHRWLFPVSVVRDVGGFEESRPDVWVMEDWLLLWKLVARGTQILYVDEPLALYRRHAANMTANIPKAAKGHFIALDRVDDYQRTHQCNFYSRSQLRALRESYHYELGLHYVRSNQIYRACRELLPALGLSSNRQQAKLLLLVLAPLLRSRAIDWARSADSLLWRMRDAFSRMLRNANVFSQRSPLRNRFYQWRQRRPLKRTAALTALLFMWPAVVGLRRVWRLLSTKKDTRHVLVIHFGGLGDTLMLTPALRALKKAFPNARVDVITLHEHVKSAFSRHPRIDSITALPAYNGRWIVSRFAGLSGAKLILATLQFYPELLLRFIGKQYDVGVNFGLCDFDRKLGDSLLGCLDVERAVLSSPAGARTENCHRVEEYNHALTTLGIQSADTTLEYLISNVDIERAKLVLRNQGVDESRRLAVIHPGGKLHINSRRWPAEYFTQVCAFLFNEGFEVVLTGDREDAEVCRDVARSAKVETISLAGDLTFSESAALLSLADLVITNDTATLHLADAAGTSQVVSIFGPTDPSLLAPRNARHVIFRSDLPCAPCMGGTIDANTERCSRDVKEECLWRITPDQVIAKLRDVYAVPAVHAASA